MSSLSNESLRVIQRAALDPELRRIMQELGPLLDFGPDPRKAIQWLKRAMLRAEKDEVFRDRHLIETAVETLGIAGKDSFSEGQQPRKRRRKELLLRELAEVALARADLIDLLEPSTAFASVASKFSRLLGRPSPEACEVIRRALETLSKGLEEAQVADRELRVRRFLQFLESFADLDLNDPVVAIAGPISRAKDSGLMDDDGIWTCAGSRRCVRELAAIAADSKAGTILEQLGNQRLTAAAEIEWATSGHPLARRCDSLLRSLVAQPELGDSSIVARGAALLHGIRGLSPGSAVEPVVHPFLDTMGDQRRFLVNMLGYACEWGGRERANLEKARGLLS